MAKFYKTFGKASKRAKKDKKYVVGTKGGWNVVGKAKYHNHMHEHKKRMRKNWGQRRHW